ncbi:PfkB family carbohydrate kinase [Micromonospora sp. NPDC049679]|uniref:PfkB family carbohydrate kinase n=1 Tax=Micromonospora sp. NPDC049679 TaxID=3155920 RepID=UPI0033F22E0A
MTGRLVVVGDTLLDRDVDGAVQRVCPDAPAPVLDERCSADRPGGAGLAALLAAGQGFEVHLVTALVDDAGGARLSEMLTAAGVQVYALPLTGVTPEKIRLRTRGQVLLRLDRGGPPAAPGEPSEAVLDVLAEAAAIVVSDYGRGVARHPALRSALAAATAPIVWDPHPRGPAAVPGVRLATPNETEVRQLTGEISGVSRLSAASRGAQELRQRWQAGAVAVTMGGEGALLCHAGSTPLVVATTASAQGDTCGAGDRFAAVAAAALAEGAVVSEAVQEAVEQATAYVAAGGVAAALPGSPVATGRVATAVVAGPVAAGRARASFAPGPVAAAAVPATGPLADPAGTRWPRSPGGGQDDHERIGAHAAGAVVAAVRARGGTVVATGGCFDLLHAGHVAALQAARRLGDCLIVCLNSDTSVAGLKGPERPVVSESDRSRLLAALGCVDAVVVFDESTPHAVLSWLRPDIWVKGGDYAGGGGGEADLPEAALVRRWGGQTAIVPYLDGHSTTGMIAAARAGRGRGAKEER